MSVEEWVRKGMVRADAPRVVRRRGCREEEGREAVRRGVRKVWCGRRRERRVAGEVAKVRVEVWVRVRPRVWMLKVGGGLRAGRRSMVVVVVVVVTG